MKTITRRSALRSFSVGAAGFLFGGTHYASAATNIFNAPNYAQVFGKNIPVPALNAAQELASAGIATMNFTPQDGWVVVAKNGQYRAGNIPDACKQKIEAFIKAGHKIQCVAFPPQGSSSYLVVSDQDFAGFQLDTKLTQELTKLKSSGTRIKKVAFRPKRGNDRWIILTEKGVIAQNIQDDCYQMLRNLQESPSVSGQPVRKINDVSFSATGGWNVCADDYAHNHKIPSGCAGQINNLKGQRLQTDLVVFSTQGWCVISNQSFSQMPTDEIRTFEKAVRGGGIWKRMSISKVPGVSVGVVIDNKLAWSCSYGFLKTGGTNAAHPESIFQAGSLSQLVSTIGALRLVRLGKFGLEQDLRDDKLGFATPISASLKIDEGQEPTLGLLLGNRCGFNVTGLKGYSKGRPLPNLENILNGKGGANNFKVEIKKTPNTAFEPSSGGYIFLDKMIKKITSQPANRWLDDNVLKPLEMKDSSFDVNIDNKYVADNNVAAGHNPNGGMLTGERYRYPESSAYGLNTNVKDMANIISMINQGGSFKGQTFLTTDMVEALLTRVNEKEQPNRALGGLNVTPFDKINATGSNFRYSTSGQCVGFRSILMGYPIQGTGVVVMANGNAKDGPRFCFDVANAVIGAYGWEK